MPRRRLAVALLVPSPTDAEVDALRRAAGDDRLGRVPAHCTLVPPVNVREDRLADALARLRGAAAEVAPVAVHLGPPASFWPASPVRHLPVTGPGVEGLARLRELVFAEPLARPLSWPYVPHVTLADGLSAARLDAAVAAMAGYEADVTFERVHLLAQEDGRVWRPLADAGLVPPAVIGRGGLPVELSVTDLADPEALAFAAREWARPQAASLGRSFVVTARRHGEVVGVAWGATAGDRAWLAGVVVGAACRGEGVGSHLVAAVKSLAAERGCAAVAAAAPAGSPAEAFYRSRGLTVDEP